ncbi:nicotinate-nucleotide--dimethylbenzimidazole phosphoribosyltransferase [Streptomyces sp. NPDC002566]|uniref:nicotinate-nucleotide--dimethylbenzimidazole phosphoribosyltransferase n=2 Tax=unclassified Streptomyces TaxID=2593676 RepID=UPI00369A768E
MTDTGQVPGEGLPESADTAEQPGVSTSGAYAYLSETTAEDEDLLLLPGAQSAWGNEVAPPAPEPVVETVHEPGPHEMSGRDTGSVDLGAVRLPGPTPAPAAPRRPLHLGPPIPDAFAGPVRSLADRGPAGAPVRQPAAPAPGPEYLDAAPQHATPPQGAAPWGAQVAAQAVAQAPVASGAAPAEAAAPPAQAGPVGVAQAVVARVATEASAATGAPQEAEAGQTAEQTVPAGAPQEADPVHAGVAATGATEDVQVPAGAESGGAEVTAAVSVPVPASAPVEVPASEAAPEAVSEPEPVAEPEPEPESVPVAERESVPVAQPAPEGEVAAVPTVDVADAAAAEAVEASASAPVEEPVSEAEAAQEVEPVAAAVVEAAAAPEADVAVAPEAPEAVEVPAVPAAPAAEEPEAVVDTPAAEAVEEASAPAAESAPEPVVAAPEAGRTPDMPAPEAPQASDAPAAPAEPAPQASEPAPEPAQVPEVVQEVQEAEPVVVSEQPEAVEPAAEPVVPEQEAVVPAPEAVPPVPEAVVEAQTEAPVAAPSALDTLYPKPVAAAEPAHPEHPEVPEGAEHPEPTPAPADQIADQASHAVDDVEPQPAQPQDDFTSAEAEAEADTPHVPEPLVEQTPHPVAEPPAVMVPAPRAAEAAPAPATPEAEPQMDQEQPDPNVAQNPDDLDTMAADHDELTESQEPHALHAPAEENAPAEANGQAEANEQAEPSEREHEGAEAEAVEAPRRPVGPPAPAYADAEREAVLKVIRERRDIRNGFRSDPIPHEVLLRVLEAAHTAPSVGHSQPWDFVVIRSAETRRAMHELAQRQREAYAKSLPKGRAKQFKELKIEAILDTPVNIVVTADPTRGGRHTLGRHTQPQMAPYSSALAVENLWLAARAEGLGVGWVSFFDEREMVRALDLPEHLEVVAYLCVGYVDEFPEEPELMQAGWAKRRPLSWVVHEETYGRRALPGADPHDLLAETVASVRPLDAKALGEAWERQKRMTKPAGALGMLEIISAQLSGLSRQCPPPIPEPAAVAIFAGDHGVHAQGVTPWPQEVTAQMVANFLGGGAVCNAFASQVGAEVCVVDVGVATDLPATPGLLPRKIRAGTSDMTTGPAMTREEAKQAIEVGIETARDLVAAGNKALLTGEMGIANTTASAALISVFTGADPAEVTGRGTGINDETLARKTEVVRRALELHQPDPADPVGVLAAIGGFEHAAMVGLLLGGASLRTPVILDGVSAGAAALVARAIAPEVLAACIAGHRSAEPGHVAALNKLGLRPLVDLDLRLGEGTGALLALPLVQSTARAMHEVATFDSAGVTEK